MSPFEFNVRGLRNKEKRNQMFRWFRHQKAQVVFLQETYWSRDIENIVRSEWRGPCFFSHGSNHACGVAILFQQNLAIEQVKVKHGKEGRLLIMHVKIHDISMVLVNVYAPTQKKYRDKFYCAMLHELQKECQNEETRDSEIILGGDWNCILNVNKDVQGTKSKFYSKQKYLQKVIKKFNLCDVWRKTHPKVKQFTWRNVTLKRASRLDFWLVDKSVYKRTISTDIRPSIRADHNAISLKINLQSIKKGPGYWKLNASILSDKLYQRNICDIIESVSATKIPAIEKWEILKIKIGEYTQKFCRNKAFKTKNNKSMLEEKLCSLEKKINVNEQNIKLENYYARVREKLEHVYKIEAKGAGIRSRVRWMEEGEKNTKYFLGLEKNNIKKKEIRQIKSENGNRVLKKHEEIMKEVRRYYAQLYNKENNSGIDMKSYVFTQTADQLSDDQKERCEGLLTTDECKRAIFAMKKNKAPGCDGISIEFYQTFWPQIKEILVNALNECYITGTMSNTQRKGLITLLFKKGDTQSLKNWRPITLLNCDYKIIAAVLAARLQKVIRYIVHESQTGYIKGRLASTNVRLVKDIIKYFKNRKESGAIMLVDFTKAFDVLDTTFLDFCLEKFNFGSSFRKWVRVLYTNIVSSVLVNGWTSEPFCVERGIRQGCPLSALLFVLAVEFMANKIRSNEVIKPFDIPKCSTHFKLLQYADDTLFFIRDECSLKEILDELCLFGKVAGPKLNKDKTIMMWIGDKSKRWNLKQHDLIWTEKPIKYLGHFIFIDANIALETEWTSKLSKLQKILDNWKRRNLTIFGKVTVLKSLALSQIIHLIIVDSIPNIFLNKLNRLIYQFIWGSKIEKVKRCTLTKDYVDGGIKMIDIKKQMFSFRLKWLGQLLNENKGMWKEMAHFWFNKLGGINLLLHCDYNEEILKIVNEKKIPVFYGEVLYAWMLIRSHVHGKSSSVKENTSEEILWYNQNITLNKRTLFYGYWYDAGITFFKDVVKNKCLLSVENISSKITSKKGKGNLVFDYVKLRKALPTVWIQRVIERNENILENRILQTPSLSVHNKKKSISDLNSKCYYKLILLNSNLEQTPYCCLFWENELEVDIDWPNVFKRYFICNVELHNNQCWSRYPLKSKSMFISTRCSDDSMNLQEQKQSVKQ